ncbi:MAG: neutral/alkaline non-lysosomal ceramidase N-terminal domain-containing protein [Acidobacteria bacterium]|nr:neutral/alkaline non-lysosomal ceramidase N-terminal domain-containing protein [Acidobacteriota bacterium]
MRHGAPLPLVCLALAAPLAADVIEQGVKDARPSGLLAGVARADISPPVGIPHLNWGSQTHVEAQGIDPAGMYATALVLSDGKQKLAMVDVDALNPRGWEPAIARAAELTGIAAAHIRLAATHTHSGPAFQREKGPVGVDPAKYERMMAAYRTVLLDKIAGVIAEANSKLRPAHAWGAKGAGTINVNRRVRASGDAPPAVGTNPEGFVDRELVVIRIDDAAGRPLAVLVNFQCHGTVLTYENKLISPDWIGSMRGTVERALPGALALYFQGAAGNQGPVEGGTGDLAVAHRLGSILGHEAAALALQVETVRREPRFEGFVESTAFAARQPWRVIGPRDATLKFASKLLDLPPRTYTPEEVRLMEQQVADAERRVQQAHSSGDPWRKHQAEARRRRFADLLAKWRNPSTTPVALEVTALRIGVMAIVAMPGEPFAEIGAAVKKTSPFALTMFCGYSTGQGGDYMPVESEYRHGGYEVERTPYGAGAAGKLIKETVALLERLR